MNWMLWICGYFGVGVVVFVLLAYALDSERPPAGWWRDHSFLLATLAIVVLWPGVVYLWLTEHLR